jgi:hypothetical protein
MPKRRDAGGTVDNGVVEADRGGNVMKRVAAELKSR